MAVVSGVVSVSGTAVTAGAVTVSGGAALVDVTAVATGSAAVAVEVATADDEKATASQEFQVKDSDAETETEPEPDPGSATVAITGSAISSTGLTLPVNDTAVLEAETTLKGCALSGSAVWTSSDEDVVTVTGSADGKATVTAKGVGTATVSVSIYTDTGLTAEDKIDVTSPIELKSTCFTTFSDMGIALDENKTYDTITIKLKAWNADGSEITTGESNTLDSSAGSKISVGTQASCNYGYGSGIGWNNNAYSVTCGYYFLNNLGKYGVSKDDEGYFNVTIKLNKYKEENSDKVASDEYYAPVNDYDGLGFQAYNTKDEDGNVTGTSKIQIFGITLHEASSETAE